MNTYPAIVYVVAALTSLGCMVLFMRGYRRAKVRLLLWSALCFVGLTINNFLLVVDLVVLPELDLGVWRNTASLAGLSFLLLGFIWDSD